MHIISFGPQKTVQIQKSDTGVSFCVMGETFQQISRWEYSVDKKAFEEQLATGYTQAGLKIPDTFFEAMQRIQQRGEIQPYFGVGGGRGCFNHQFQVLFSGGCVVKVKHPEMKDTIEITLPQDKTKPLLKFLCFVYPSNPNHLDSCDKPHDNELLYKISGKEFQNLRAWGSWVEAQALTSRYVYTFGPTSLGVYVTVKDTETNDEINITDYSGW